MIIRSSFYRRLALCVFAAVTVVWVMPPLDARQAIPPGLCRIDGKAISGAVPLPGVAIIVKSGDVAATATSTETDGKYQAC